MKQSIDTLIPVDLYNDIKVTGSNKFKATPVLKASDGTIITKDLPEPWLIYMKHAINNYGDMIVRQSRAPADNPIIVDFTLPGKPIAKEITKGIIPHDDGTFTMSYDRDFKNRLKYLMDLKPEITRYKESQMPVKATCIVEMIFYITKTPNKHYSLSELVTSTLELLVKLKIVKNTSCEIVARTDGSKICYTKDIEKTVVTIRKLTGGIK